MVMMEVNLRVKWQDTRLRPPPELGPAQYVPLDPAILTRIWVPDLYIGEREREREREREITHIYTHDLIPPTFTSLSDHSTGANTPSVLTSIASVWIYGDTTVDYSGK